MALAKYYEEIVEQRLENKARIGFDYQHPQASFKLHIVPTEPRKLTLDEKVIVWNVMSKLKSETEQVGTQLLSQIADWSPAHFLYLAQRWPEATARLLIVYRDQSIKRAA